MRPDAGLLSIRCAAIFGFVLMSVGCATANPEVDTSASDDGLSFDGLYPVKDSRADAAWARPDADISRYSKIMLQGVGVEYRPGGASGRLYHTRSGADHYELTEEQKARFEMVMADKFREELAKSEHFTIVDGAAPDVLLIRGRLIDVVSYVPPKSDGRSEVLLHRVGEATLVLEICDSVSEAVIVRAVDRRAFEKVLRATRTSNTARTPSEVRRVAGEWARLLRERLDSFAEPTD